MKGMKQVEAVSDPYYFAPLASGKSLPFGNTGLD